ncbi:MAG: ABC transporter substrate-binding protein [Nitrososphaerales archaeon]|nr:ABC transporter substrate-binding protein [Nitrososphaerales archaeon]
MNFLRRRSGISTSVLALIVVVVILVAAIAGYVFLTGGTRPGSSSVSGAKTVNVVFGATLSMTGPLQAFGQEQNWTLSLAVSAINGYGGIPLANGSRALVKLVVLDDKTDPTVAQTNLQTLVSQYNSLIALGELGGVQDSVAQEFATRNQVPYIGPVYISSFKSCTGSCSNSWVFSPFQNETNEARIFFDWFRTIDPSTVSHKVTVAFFGEGDPAAEANNLAGEAYARSLGYTVCTCSDLTFTPGSSSEMSSFITAAKSAGAEAVYGLPLPPDAVLMVQTAHQLDYSPNAWLLTRGTAVAPFAIPALGGGGNLSVGVMSAFPWQPAVPYTGILLGHQVNNSDIVGKYEAFWHHPPTLEGVYYTEVLVAANAIQAAGTLDRTSIRNALRSTTFQTPQGQVSFTPGGQWVQSGKYMLLMQWQNVVVSGTTIQALQILEPTGIATTSYVIYPYTTINQQRVPWPPA